MKTIFTHLVALVLATGLVCTAAAQAATTAQVNITVSIQPFASVSLDTTSVQVTFTNQMTQYGPVTVGGTVKCNVPVSLYARVTKPDGAPGTWVAVPVVGSVSTIGVSHFNELLSLTIIELPAGIGGQTYTVLTQGQFASTAGDIQNPQVGVVTLTVVPQ